jgi:HD-like signal output (HDOD) protein
MVKRNILLAVADPQVLVEISQALGARWEAVPVASEADALAQLEKRSFDALLVDFNLGSPDGSELLNQALEKRPEIIRFLLAYEADLALVDAKVLGPHRILPKPIERASLKSSIESGMAPEESNARQSESDPVTGVSDLLTMPSVYAEVLKALNSPSATNEQVGALIARDAALTTELLGLTHSAYLGLPRNITDPVEAVGSLGLETVKGLVLALQFLTEHTKLKPGYLSLEQIWQHSIHVAQIARDLVLFETKDRTLASEALTAGLLHDLGKVVLVSNFDDLYGRVHSLARKQPVPLWDIEKEIFGASHGEIGGCLVGMWNVPRSIVEAAALHHEPPLGEHQRLTPLAAVHIANVLEHEIWRSDEGLVAPAINTAFLNELGLLERLPVWRAVFGNRSQAGSIAPVSSAAPPSRSANYLPGPAAATGTTTSEQPRPLAGQAAAHASRSRQRRWVYAGVAAGILILLNLWIRTQPELDTSELVRARTPSPKEVPVVVSSTTLPETARATVPQVTATAAKDVTQPEPNTPETLENRTPTPPEVPVVVSLTPPPETVLAAVPEVTPAMGVSEEAWAADVSVPTIPEPGISLPEPEPIAAFASQATTSTSIPPPSLTPKEQAPSEFRLRGIIYTVFRPSAIVNGKTVFVGDRVSGAAVIDIGRTYVTLEINGQRKTYDLP